MRLFISLFFICGLFLLPASLSANSAPPVMIKCQNAKMFFDPGKGACSFTCSAGYRYDPEKHACIGNGLPKSVKKCEAGFLQHPKTGVCIALCPKGYVYRPDTESCGKKSP